MKQVKLWIAVCPFELDGHKEILWRLGNNKNWCPRIKLEVCTIIESKIFEINNCSTQFLIKGETYETIIQALWKYQKNLIAKVQGIGSVTSWFPVPDDYPAESYEIIHNGDKWNFYNPETGIITITEFE